MLIRHLIYLFIIVLALLSGCSTTPPQPVPASTDPLNDPAATAKKLDGQGKYIEAAREYLRLAAIKSAPTRQGYQLSAIQSLLKAGKYKEAKAELERLDVSQSFGLELPLELVRIRLDVVENRADKALERLRGIEPTSLPASFQIEYRQLHAQALAAKGDVLAAYREWDWLNNQFSKDPKALKSGQRYWWQSLSALSTDQLRSELQKVQKDEVLAGWIALALLVKTVQPKRLSQAINDWGLRYSNHPASQDIAKSLAQTVASLPAQSVEITLLLPPVESKFGKQGEVVKQGFFAAAYAIEEKNRPHVNIRPVTTKTVLKEYEAAVNDGADFIVGPIEKDVLAVLANSQPVLPVPTLGLNYLETATVTGNFYQFGLLPEDEAQEAARQAWQDGRRLPLVLVPEGDWGDRVLSAFQTTWEGLGGKIAFSLGYDTNFVSAIRKVLKNQAADMAFMVAFPDIARQMRPYFISEIGDQFPVYSTSHVYSGTPNPQADEDLDGIMFVDMPWVLAPDATAMQLQATLEESWPDSMLQFKRLFAFGVDAYTLLPRLQQLTKAKANQSEWLGQTGPLTLNSQGEIHRHQLLWARFVNGVPQVLRNGTSVKK